MRFWHALFLGSTLLSGCSGGPAECEACEIVVSGAHGDLTVDITAPAQGLGTIRLQTAPTGGNFTDVPGQQFSVNDDGPHTFPVSNLPTTFQRARVTYTQNGTPGALELNVMLP